jgi:hypothetical protein
VRLFHRGLQRALLCNVLLSLSRSAPNLTPSVSVIHQVKTVWPAEKSPSELGLTEALSQLSRFGLDLSVPGTIPLGLRQVIPT